MPEFFKGDHLRKAVYESINERKFYVQSFIPEHSILMFYAPDGAGKSTLSLQFCIEAASGLPVFGGYTTDKPVNILYVMAERHRMEAFERIKLMAKNLHILWDNFMITDQLQGYDLINPENASKFIDKILEFSKSFETQGGLQYIHIDPLYALTSRGLVSEEGASAVRDTLNRLQAALGCSIGYNHHSNRGVKNPKSGARMGADMYGSRFLSAHATGKYSITQAEHGGKFKCEKDSYRCLTDGFHLQYDPETYLSMISPDQRLGNKVEQFLQLLRNNFKLNKTISFDEINSEINLSHSYLRKVLSIEVEKGVLINTKPNGVKALYKVMKEP